MGIFDKFFGNKAETPKHESTELEWFNLSSIEDFHAALKFSHTQPVLLFKHSTRCSISSSAISRLKRNWKGEQVDVKPFYLDLLNHRDVSQEIAIALEVEHQSPQMIIVKNGESIFDASHMNIDFNDVKKYAGKN
jgi:bacillithiol system protein YtxJ